MICMPNSPVTVCDKLIWTLVRDQHKYHKNKSVLVAMHSYDEQGKIGSKTSETMCNRKTSESAALKNGSHSVEAITRHLPYFELKINLGPEKIAAVGSHARPTCAAVGREKRAQK